MTEVSRNHSGKIRRDIIAAQAERVEENKSSPRRKKTVVGFGGTAIFTESFEQNNNARQQYDGH
ncbi:MAG: hypothetical protein HYZ77_11255 [Serratia liquefaciens]|nr:hypothetical protein [Serratia liquefaciens]